MKTSIKSIIFASFLASLSPVWGQSYSAIAEYAGNYISEKTIVRTWGNYSLSYIRESGFGYLYFVKLIEMVTESNPSFIIPSGVKFPLPLSNMEIKDIQILEGRAYVCGQYNPNTAFYGYVDLPLTSTSDFKYYFVNNPDPYIMNKMVVYKDSISEKLVAIGNYYTLPPNAIIKDVIFEINNAGDLFPSCTTYTLPYTSYREKEALYDIVLTDDYVVFFGLDSENDISLYTRWADRSNILGTIQERYDYRLPQDEINGDLLATVIDSSKWIAVVYVHAESGSGFTTRTRLIEVSGTHDLAYSQEYSIAEKMVPYDISYNSTHEVLTVLQNCTTPTGTCKFRLLDPFPMASYSFNYLYYPDFEFTSLYQYDNDHYIATGTDIAVRSKFWYMQDLTSPFATTMNCPFVSSETANLVSSDIVIYNPQNLTSLTTPLSQNSPGITQIPVILTTLCNIPYFKNKD